MPDLSGVAVPERQRGADDRRHELNPARRTATSGWYAGAVRVTLTGIDEHGGSGVEQMHVPDRRRRAAELRRPVRLHDRGRAHARVPLDRRRRQRRDLQVGAAEGRRQRADHDERRSRPACRSAPSGWYDGAVTVRLSRGRRPRLRRRARPSTGSTAAHWTPYAPRRSWSRRRAQHRSSTARPTSPATTRRPRSLSLKVDETAPIDDACASTAPTRSRSTPGAVRVAFTRSDGDGLRRVVDTEYRLDGGDWTSLRRARSTSPATAATRSTTARSTWPATSRTSSSADLRDPPAGAAGRADPAAAGDARAAAEAVRRARGPRRSGRPSTALRGGKVAVRVSCQARRPRHAAADRHQGGGEAARSSRARTLAGGALRCGGEGRATLTLEAEHEGQARARPGQGLDHRDADAAPDGLGRQRARHADRDVQGEVVKSRGRNMKNTLRALLASALLVLACAATAQAQGVKVLVFHGPPDATTTAGVETPSRRSARPTTSTSTRPTARPTSTRPTSRTTARSSSSTPPATCSTPSRRGGAAALRRRRQRLPRHRLGRAGRVRRRSSTA